MDALRRFPVPGGELRWPAPLDCGATARCPPPLLGPLLQPEQLALAAVGLDHRGACAPPPAVAAQAAHRSRSAQCSTAAMGSIRTTHRFSEALASSFAQNGPPGGADQPWASRYQAGARSPPLTSAPSVTRPCGSRQRNQQSRRSVRNSARNNAAQHDTRLASAWPLPMGVHKQLLSGSINDSENQSHAAVGVINRRSARRSASLKPLRKVV